MGEPAYMTANGLSVAAQAEALVTVVLKDYNESVLNFDQSEIIISDESPSVITLNLSNSGVNDLENGTITLFFPEGVNAFIADTPLYTAVQQADGSWLITFIGVIAPEQMIDIPIELSVENNSIINGEEISAVFNANNVKIADAISAIRIDNKIAELFLVNYVDKSTVEHDETVLYSLELTNSLGFDSNNISITDHLPLGFRFMKGTVKLDGEPVIDPVLSKDGRTLVFAVGMLPADETAIISYMAYVTNSAPTGELNSPSVAQSNRVISNKANASIIVKRDGINIDTHIVGRVLDNTCEPDKVEEGEINLRLNSELVEQHIRYVVDMNGNGASLQAYSLIVDLPEPLQYVSGSSKLDDNIIADPEWDENKLVFNIGEQDKEWKHSLTFKVLPKAGRYGVYETQMYASYKITDKERYESTILSSIYKSTKDQNNFKNYTYWPQFGVFETDLKKVDQKYLDELIKTLDKNTINKIHVTGHSDDVAISTRSTNVYQDNFQLSEARALSVANYLVAALNLSYKQIEVIGKGPAEPIATNSTREGRAKNRRVELQIETFDKESYKIGSIIAEDKTSINSYLYTRKSAVVKNEGSGINNVRLFMEDGRFVDTDKEGRFHFEAIKPGAHVIQIDPESIPEGYEAYFCENNTRFAGNPSSQFIDIQKGLIWRSNFHLRPAESSAVSTRIDMSSAVDEEDILYQVYVSGSGSGLDSGQSKAELVVKIQQGIAVDLTTIKVNDKFVKVELFDDTFAIPLVIEQQDWTNKVSFKADVITDVPGDYRTYAHIRLVPEKGNIAYSSEVNTVVSILKPEIIVKRYDLDTHFKSSETKLVAADQYTLQSIAALLKQETITKIEVVDYSNNLSHSRAETVANFLRAELKTSNGEIDILATGASDEKPIATNNNETGIAQNRKIGLFVYNEINTNNKAVKVTRPQSLIRRDTLYIVDTGTKNTSESVVTNKILPQGFLYPQPDDVITTETSSIRVNLDSRLEVQLFVDDKWIDPDRIGFTQADPETGATIYTYFGIGMGAPGVHKLTVKGLGPFGIARVEETINYVRTGEIRKINFIEAEGNLADGETPITARLQLIDINGAIIKAPVMLEIIDGELTPYAKEDKDKQSYLKGSEAKLLVEKDGLASFNPVNTAGLYRVKVKYNDIETELKIYVKPKYRNWIMVGLAEGTVGYNDVSGNVESLKDSGIDDKYYDDGRLAFYAKGKILGKYLLTSSFDSSKNNKQDDRLLQLINPDDYYTLYGDSTEQQFDAASKEKLYLRLDGDNFYALFGDYNTGMNVTELSRYSRSFTGGKLAYESEHFSLTAFAADTDQSFIHDEILGDGTSGLYRLSKNNIVANSEQIIIQVRDRFHSNQIISERPLARFIDYNIDFADGSLYFKEPIMRHDNDLNPVYIVANYETYGTTTDVIAGGRAAVKFADEKVEIGLSHIDEGVEGAGGTLSGVDVRVDITADLKFRAEYATSESTTDLVKNEGDAYLAELKHESEKSNASLYVKETEAGFGLGQQNKSESGMRKFGTQAAVTLIEDVEFKADVSREDNLTSQSTRDLVRTDLFYTPDTWEYRVGASMADDADKNGEHNRSDTLSVGVAKSLMNERLKLHAASEISINDKTENIDYPERHRVGAEYALTEKMDIFAEHEFTQGDAAGSDTTRAGIKARPWDNTSVSSALQKDQGEFEERTFAVFGLQQTVPLNDFWRASFSYDQTNTIDRKFYDRVNEQVPLASGTSDTVISTNNTIDNDFWATTAGIGYKAHLYQFDTRLEYRETDLEEKYGLFSTWQRELIDGVGHALRLQAFITDNDNAGKDIDTELRYSSVYRPLNSKIFLFNRTELKYLDNNNMSNGMQTEKFIENLAVNYLPITEWQLALHLGYKFTNTRVEDDKFSTDTYLIGSETRYDLSPLWDIGAHYHLVTTPDLNITNDSYGLSVGVDVARNLWLSIGYNIDGYTDDDFNTNGYTAKGPFLKLRFKFDQNTFNLND